MRSQATPSARRAVPRPSARVRRATSRIASLALVGALGTVPFLGAGTASAPESAPPESAPMTATDLAPVADEVPADRGTRIRMSSFNVLGHGHTEPGGSRGGGNWADGRQRMRWASKIVANHNLDVIGFQELQRPQWKVFRQQQGDRYRMFPSAELSHAAMQNSIAWDYTEWFAAEKRTIRLPYFKGNRIKRPYVQLRNRDTDRRVWVINNHHPANTHGNAEKWRNRARNAEIRLIKRLQRANPRIPVIVLGDKNERRDYVCPMMRRTDMTPANGGGITRDGTCRMPRKPKRMPVDWILGSEKVKFSHYVARHTRLVRKTTDHRVIVAQAMLPSVPVLTSGIRRVVLINVSGLNSRQLQRLSPATMPTLRRLRREGASTMNARTLYERTAIAPNVAGMLTSRPADRSRGGTGIGVRAPSGTIHRSAGHQVASVFDLLHDRGRATGLFASERGIAKLFRRSYNSTHGPADHTGLNNGRDKITDVAITGSDRTAVSALVRDLKGKANAFNYLHLRRPSKAASEHGARSGKYAHALRATDRQLRRVITTIERTRGVRNRTVVLLTTDRGGTRAAKASRTAREVITVPFVAWGRGVARGADLYDLNPHYADPGNRRPRYTAKRDPIRNAYAGNLAAKLLRVAPITGSNLDSGHTFSVF